MNINNIFFRTTRRVLAGALCAGIAVGLVYGFGVFLTWDLWPDTSEQQLAASVILRFFGFCAFWIGVYIEGAISDD